MIKQEEYSELKDKSFVLTLEDGTKLNLELIEVSELRELDTHKEFSLVFTAPPGNDLIPSTYTLQNDELGELDLFLCPFSADENGLKLEAAFSIAN